MRQGSYLLQMCDVCNLPPHAVDPECVLAVGDIHHFNGVASTQDPLWLTNYEYVYSHPDLMLDWFPVCGNHEYRGNTQAFMDYGKVSRRWMMPDGGTRAGWGGSLDAQWR